MLRRDRGVDVSARSTVLYWVTTGWPPDDSWSKPLDEVQYGDRISAQVTINGMLISLERLSGSEWDLELSVVPAP